ncbi:MAG: hypothetical protein ACOYVD_09475 [Bacillota bacterium]
MLRYLEQLCRISIAGLVLTIFLKEFTNIKILGSLEVFLLVVVISTCLVLAKGIPFYMSLTTLTLGHILLFKYQMGYQIWLEGITKNLPLAIIFVMVPILSIPLRLGGYLQAVSGFVGNFINKTGILFSALSSAVYGLSSITNLGAIRIVHTLLEDVKFPPRFLGRAYCVGFASVITWSPYFASVNLVLYYTGVDFSRFFIFGFMLGILYILLGNLIFFTDKTLQLEVQESIKKVPFSKYHNRKILQLFFNLIALFAVVVIGEKFFNFSSMMFLVSFLAVVYAAVWSLFLKEFRLFARQLKGYYQGMIEVKNELVFFISVGFFGVVLANTPLQKIIENIFRGVSDYSTFILVEFILIVIALLSIVGIHHIITITTLGLTIKASMLGMTDISYSLTLIAAYGLSMVLSPFAPFNIITGGLTKEPSFIVSLKWNLTFGAVAILFSGIYITFVNSMF